MENLNRFKIPDLCELGNSKTLPQRYYFLNKNREKENISKFEKEKKIQIQFEKNKKILNSDFVDASFKSIFLTRKSIVNNVFPKLSKGLGLESENAEINFKKKSSISLYKIKEALSDINKSIVKTEEPFDNEKTNGNLIYKNFHFLTVFNNKEIEKDQIQLNYPNIFDQAHDKSYSGLISDNSFLPFIRINEKNSEILLRLSANSGFKDTERDNLLGLIQGLEYEQTGYFTKAIRFYKNYLELVLKHSYTPGLSFIYNRLGICYYKVGSIKESLKSHKNCLSSIEASKRYVAYSNLGIIFLIIGELKMAEEYFKKGLNSKNLESRQRIRFRILLAVIYFLKNDFKISQEFLKVKLKAIYYKTVSS